MHSGHHAHTMVQSKGPSETGIGFIDFFTAGGNYMPRTHCLVNEAGETDWPWAWLIGTLSVLIVAGYLRIFSFWRKAYLKVDLADRNNKMMQLAWVFLFCAICGYVANISMFIWPAYRLHALVLVPLCYFTWMFASNLEPFRVSLEANKLQRELRAALEQRASELERDVQARTQELEDARKLADDASRAKTAFIANISHEIRTPMNAIVGFTDLLEEDRSDERQHTEHVGTIRRNTHHLLQLINDVLDMSKIEAGSLDIESLPVNPQQVSLNVRDTFTARARERGVMLGFAYDADLPGCITSDPTRLTQIISNLVGNAIKFTPEGGAVSISVTHANEKLRVSVRDSGPGVPPEVQARLFRSFMQADASTTRKHGGTGLGLKISRDLARKLGGDVWLEESSSDGTVFVCEVAAPIAETPVHAAEDELSARATPDPLRGTRVLLVEDGEDNARLARLFLTRAGADMERAENGLEAVQRFEQCEHFDLVLMDVQMPVMDGHEATRRLRAMGVTTPIVAATANALLEDRDRCMDAGCDAFIAKPFRRNELIQTCLQWTLAKQDLPPKIPPGAPPQAPPEAPTKDAA